MKLLIFSYDVGDSLLQVEEPIYGAECFTYGFLASGFVDVIVQSFLDVSNMLYLSMYKKVEGSPRQYESWCVPCGASGSWCALLK